MAKKYTIELTAIAEKIYRRFYQEAEACREEGDSSSQKITTFNMVDEAIEKIIPSNLFARERALKGPLSNIFRVKKGRLRIFYVASSSQRRIVILYISETLRKAGSVVDPYSIFTGMVLSGKYDKFFERLGVRKPNRRASILPPSIQ